MITSNHNDIDLGDVKLGETKSFHFLIKNEYTVPVHVGVGFGCGSCTNGGFYPDNSNLQPDESRVFTAKFTPTGSGLQTKTIRFNYLPPKSQEAQKLVVRFKANVI